MAKDKKARPEEDESLDARHGKKPNQKLKPYLVFQILMKNTDEDHVMSAVNIVAALEDLGIESERRSIYTDIEEINKACWAWENGATVQEAEEAVEDDDEKLIVYDKQRKGFYVRQRRYD